MAKLVEGQLSILAMVGQQSAVSRSFTSSMLRRVVHDLQTAQALYPDVVPRNVSVRPTVEASTGRIVSSIA